MLFPIAEDILARVNRDRVRLGLPALVAPPDLRDIAFRRCESMVARGYFDHTDPEDGSTPARTLMSAGGFGGRLAETLYATTAPLDEIAAETVAAWMGSAENRAILLDDAYRFAGVGLMGDGTWWTITQLLAEAGP